ncbi:MAG: RNA polymerase sigma factor RpoE [Gammaproteobacteria bacterium]|nr:RNA polymerase sigma factor RpoE [Gammaproteobacteria bacterium]NIR85689.1 RNA polymerase sigma factor RpoE [Gammaproteobacteria bacterium]NIR90222.1 RNA polymerase sigma factor RpoE [Gammaproteobacteria bacterium]NIU06823.1 RNA polymerase sigma factor RpoE [Gammaproteobacteria bacterium]NIV53756.1 RNA polymerase sigma factor RpoE [Gammaproteobacteria bacterium]
MVRTLSIQRVEFDDKSFISPNYSSRRWSTRVDPGALAERTARVGGDQDVDQALVERTQRGEKEAFDLLVLKYQHKLIKLISRYIRDPSEVLDVAQESFLKAYRALPNFRGDSAFYTWLYRIAINTAKNHLVSQGRRPTEGDLNPEDAEQYDMSPELKDSATPERLMLKDEIERTVVRAIDELPADLKTAITLRELEGLSYEEIADAMDCPIGTVRSRIFRAREAINKRLEPLLD